MSSLYRFLTVCAALLIIVPVASADWSDNFDSYALDSGLHGQGGWAGWQGAPAADAYVTDVQAYSSPHSVGIIPTSDIVQEFAETTGEWEMTAWCYIPDGSTGETYFIMLNSYYPDTNYWSIQMKFDNNAGILTNELGPGQTTASIIYDQWVEVKITINLGLNLAEVYYNGTLMEPGPWYNTSEGVCEIAALDLFSDGGSTIYWDDCSLIGVGALEQTTWGNIKTIIQ